MFKKIIPLILFVVSTNVFAVDDIPVPASFQRIYGIPLDSSIVFTNYNEAVTYAAGGATTNTTAYKGQYIAVPSSGVYYINDNWELEKIGTDENFNEYVKTNHVGNVNITGALSVNTTNYTKSFDTYWGEIYKLIIGDVRPGFTPGPRTLSAGLNTTAHGEASVALGVKNLALEGHKFSFVWSGINSDQDQPYYKSHGVGTFNINPTDGLSGFYIGTNTFQEILDELVAGLNTNYVPLIKDKNNKYTAVTIGNRELHTTIGKHSIAHGNSVVASGDYSEAKGESFSYIIKITNASTSSPILFYDPDFAYPIFSSNQLISYNNHYYKIIDVDSQNNNFTLDRNFEATFDDGFVDIFNTVASGDYSYANGYNVAALGDYSIAEGLYDVAKENNTYIWSGQATETNMYWSHGDGTFNIDPTNGPDGFFIGETNLTTYLANAGGSGNFVEYVTDTNGNYTAVTIGSRLLPSLIDIGPYSFVQGTNAIASGKFSHAEGYGELIGGTLSCAANSTSVTVLSFGQQGLAVGSYIIYNNEIFTVTSLNGNHNYTIDRVISSEPLNNVNVILTAENGLYHSIRAEGDYSHAEGRGTKAIGDGSHAEGFLTKAIGNESHAEGSITESLGNISHAEGYKTTASGRSSHAEGDSTYSIGDYSHSEGKSTQAIGDYSHAEGNHTIASNKYSHTGGLYSLATNNYSYVWSGNDKKEITITVTNDESIILSNYGTIDQSFTVGDIFTTGNWYDIDQIVIDENKFLAWGWIPEHSGHIALIETNDSEQPTITDISESLISTYSYLITNSLTYKLFTDFAESATVKIPLTGIYYPSHGEGTFNINPTEGLEGFYIGDSNLQSKFDEYVKTAHIGDVRILGILDLDGIIDGQFAGALKSLKICNSSIPVPGTIYDSYGYHSLASGYDCRSKGNNSVALGSAAVASNESSFVWSGSQTGQYYDHSIGSFNINPNGGITNVWIGTTNFEDHVINIINNMINQGFEKDGVRYKISIEPIE